MSSVASSRTIRRNNACDECKRRKVRCSGDENCTNCVRDRKMCTFSTPKQKASALERRLERHERLIKTIEKAWTVYVPNISLNEAIQNVESGATDQVRGAGLHDERQSVAPEGLLELLASQGANEQLNTDTSPAEHSNAEDFEFDESHDFDNGIDGMGFLTTEPSKAGYTGPQSGIAALKFLQSLPLSMPISNMNEGDPLDYIGESEDLDSQDPGGEEVDRYTNDYFLLYHPAYPLLHEGTFRARVSGALAKPRDGSWLILYNMVLAMGAFVGDSQGSKNDVRFYKTARKHLSMDILEKGSLCYVQGLALMANYLQKRNKPNAGFVLVGIGWSMALAIGLHREFGESRTTPFIMELRRRVWWTVYGFVSGAQLTLGRPPASLAGVNVLLPSNLNDRDLSVDMEQVPPPKNGPTVTSCLIAQVKLAKIANMVQVELLASHVPRSAEIMALNQSLEVWRKELPPYFDDQLTMEPWFEIPKRVLLWRSHHLRIVLNRPILLQAMANKSQIITPDGPIGACLTAADECVESMCRFMGTLTERKRELAWYATYWLITASFVQATCFVYSPMHPLAPKWKEQLQSAVQCLGELRSAHRMAGRAQQVLQKLLDQGSFNPLSEIQFSGMTAGVSQSTGNGFFPSMESTRRDENETNGVMDQAGSTLYSLDGIMDFPWLLQDASNAEILDAAGGIMLQSSSDIPGQYYTDGSWLPA